ncbi:anti-sigma regulatory factor [Aetokthonos hydrillicola Thurmond2011]|jgi:serine/threonine-protein kinase RsbW|uniref:Anti-sigma regulatory factor n=1 Tax=Aetokthonos hydrillicola Thurmond2011 TaxID=2712845 RepID=A0AAP5IA68_9CYAN|nr:anti-sigma regulatory factor [Aetokthonos hydrillicola]MBO3463087.1 anti-sigma regulatory factor [Aetokthonos hydrillicola CCALA 1050]MBW4587032.1 anti-sigma regulatory factor [Aetokthonos hydrillicola CCALA 1050]MDR9897494.1 anti-sigma regulatory factor [Aetokthonos hydrillicola Thurmond2011]
MSIEADLLIHNSSLEVTSDLDAMATVLHWFDQFNCSLVPEQLWIEAQTALIEGFTNVVRHAHRHLSPETPVDLEVQISPEYFQIRIWDQGDPFDLEGAFEALRQETSDRAFNPLEREQHWGCIFLLKLRTNYNWTINYTRESQHRNCLLLKKKLSL